MTRPGAWPLRCSSSGYRGSSGWRVICAARGADPDPHWRALPALTRYVSPALAYGLCLWLGSDLWDGSSTVLGSMVVVVFLLLMNASLNCWDLLEAIGQQSGDTTRKEE